MLLEAPDLRLRLRRNGDGFIRVVQDEIDDAAHGPMNRHFEQALPALVKDREQRFDHRPLEPIADRHAEAGEETQLQVASEREAEADQGLGRRADERGFDPGVLGGADPGSACNGCRRQTRVFALPSKVVGDGAPELPLTPTGGAFQSRSSLGGCHCSE